MKKKKNGGTTKTRGIKKPTLVSYPKPMRRFYWNAIRILQKRLFLHEWSIDISWHRVQEPSKAGTIMHIYTNATYLTSTLHVEPLMLTWYWEEKNRDYRKMFEMICHELCHIHTDPLYFPGCDKMKKGTREYNELREIRERQTQRMAVIVSSLIPEKEYMP